MKKIIVILTVFALSTLWGQKEIPTSVGDGEGAIDERVSANQVKSIDPEMIQQIRAIKVTKERMHIKKEMMNGKPSGPKSFKVSNSESKFLAIKEIIDQKKKTIQDNATIKSNNKGLNEINFEKIEVKLPGSHK